MAELNTLLRNQQCRGTPCALCRFRDL